MRLNTILSSFDPVAVDVVASEMLGHVAGRIECLQFANGLTAYIKELPYVLNSGFCG